MEDQVGVIIEAGLSDWQIVRTGCRGLGRFCISGRWIGGDAVSRGEVETRLVSEETGVPVSRALDWVAAETSPDGRWSATLEDVPAGGLYRLETRLSPRPNPAYEWSMRGDMRHFLGVGDVWIIAGQSNSAGYGRGPVHDPPELGVHLFRNSEHWSLATHPMNESTDTRHPVNREGGNPGHSPYLQFARLLKRELNVPIGLVQTALGGSPLTRWNPEEPGPADLFENMVRCVDLAGGGARGVLWYQGESDAGGENARTYADRFIDAVRSWREALKTPNLAVVTVQLNRVYGPSNDEGDRGWSQLREAQRQVPRRLEGIAVVPTLDLPLSDGIHISPAGNLVLGERLAHAALGTVHGRPILFQAPDLQSARKSEDGGRVRLAFSPVTSRMDTIDRTANPFRVEDGEGIVPIREVDYPLDATIELALERPLVGHAVVHGGYGADPAIVPADMERFMPMLGFYGVPVEE